MNKIRLDEYLLYHKLIDNMTIAHSIIRQGKVYVDNYQITKPGTLIAAKSDNVTIKKPSHDYVSRGALKLIAALDHFAINPENLICLDIGSSTGGFTEVLLRRKAKMIFSVDVAYGELHYKLRNNPKILVIERTNARYLTQDQITMPPDLIVCDASFISLMKILPIPLTLAKKKSILIALIKPQFEVAKHEVGVGGIIRSSILQQRTCTQIKLWLESHYNFRIDGILASPILGMKGNQEFLICGQRI